ncbi:sugar-binding transcriptional regulator [Anaerostipes sp.]|uniref:sugar-binding transcriptional regulator n=1 Tax=Anaerostipes sp. TaxID=1872530 RepID=UPI0025C22308|nr:sugar-binding transcriptional regulator [Anaerostipes sp.]MBS7009184.1 sugar-binding transcriptional regulator [Anaerostipes sp.]
MKNDRFLIKVAELYYQDGLSQEKIAKKLNTSRTTVSRTLIKARKEGYVRIHINYPDQSNMKLEKQLEKQYDLKEAVVAVPGFNQTAEQAVSFQAADYIIRVLKKNMTFGLTWGRAMFHFVDQLEKDSRIKSLSFQNVKVVPFLGTPSGGSSDHQSAMTYSNILATEVGGILSCISYNLSAPMSVEDENVKQMIEGIGEISSVLKIAEQADVAVFGIGSLGKDSSILKAGIRTEEEYRELENRGGVGEIVGRIYDARGETVDQDMKKKMIGISLECMRQIPIRVGIAYGKDKTEAIKGALRGKIINVLITDAATAESVLN